MFGYPEDSFALGRFKIIEGVGLVSREAMRPHGKPIILGASAAEILDKASGDCWIGDCDWWRGDDEFTADVCDGTHKRDRSTAFDRLE